MPAVYPSSAALCYVLPMFASTFLVKLGIIMSQIMPIFSLRPVVHGTLWSNRDVSSFPPIICLFVDWEDIHLPSGCCFQEGLSKGKVTVVSDDVRA